ncbi:flagellar basal body protein [Rhodoferax sp. WC2427]|uniref:flagellar basal body protein n=1 Tax=Rhodoferax sp. WC2427 TaxID=3234144 RepID=UPI003466ED3C
MNITSSTASIALSGLQSAQTRLQVSAHNIANSQTEGFQPLQVAQSTQTGGGASTQITRSSQPGTGLEADVVAQLQAKNAFLANLSVFKTQDAVLGTLLNAQA